MTYMKIEHNTWNMPVLGTVDDILKVQLIYEKLGYLFQEPIKLQKNKSGYIHAEREPLYTWTPWPHRITTVLVPCFHSTLNTEQMPMLSVL